MTIRVALLAMLALSVAGAAASQTKPPEVSTRGPAVPRPGLDALKHAQVDAARAAVARSPIETSAIAPAGPKEPPITTTRPLADAELAARAALLAAHPVPAERWRGSALAPRPWTPPKRTAPDVVTAGPTTHAPLDAVRRAKLARAQAAPATGK